jgi:hypothetical protein
MVTYFQAYHCMLLVFLITFLIAAHPRKPPRQADIDFCRSNVTLEPWNIAIKSIPDDFPKPYVTEINNFLKQAKNLVKVRNANFSEPPVNLSLVIEFDDTEDFIAATEATKYDRCGRPNQALITWSTKFLQRTPQQFLSTFVHELMHVMGGFNHHDSPYYFFFGKKANTKFEGLIYGYIKQVKDIFYAVSPGVLEEVHKINPNLIGAPLACYEGQGEDDLVYPDSHWHKDLFKDQIGCDLMLPHADDEAHLSKITVAMINDFGWYEIDYDNLNHFLQPTFEVLARKLEPKKWIEKVIDFLTM